MIEVRIRKEDEPTTHAVRLCELDVVDIPTLIESVLEYGLIFDGGDGCTISISHHYVYYNAEAYFEIVINERPGEEQSEDESEPDDS